MAYSELIKSLDTLRMYIRSFYLYGFKGREGFSQKSARTYDDEKRRIENYLSGYMAFRQDAGGKVTFVSIDSRQVSRNPFYTVFKAKSFTAQDIFIHFSLMDILYAPEVKLTLREILDEMGSVYLDGFSPSLMPEESGVRKKLKEYEALGLVRAEKQGKAMLYSRADSPGLSALQDAVSFFSEAAPCGILGNFLLDKYPAAEQKACDVFAFRHHYLTSAIESDFLCMAFEAIRDHRFLNLNQGKGGDKRIMGLEVVPLMIYQSTQGGRMYLMAYRRNGRYFLALRFDYILSMKLGGVYDGFEQKRAEFELLRKNIWGVALKQNKKHNDISTEHVTFTVRFGEGEEYIYQRLLREKRYGTVTLLDGHTARFDADVYDPQELFPWARTFICRITEFGCSDGYVTRRFYDDIRTMSRMYGLTDGKEAGDAVQ